MASEGRAPDALPPLGDDDTVRRLLLRKRYARPRPVSTDAFLLRGATDTRPAERELSVHIMSEISRQESKATMTCFCSVTLRTGDVRGMPLAALDVVRDPALGYHAGIVELPNPDDDEAHAYFLVSLLAEVATPER